MTSLASEAGFVELDPGFIGAHGVSRARMFYAFQPADSAPEGKPLLLFFQGGPFASMLPLWGGNTGPSTLDPSRTPDSPIAPNPSSWSRFANLLYVDSPYAGFSYIVGGDVRSVASSVDGSWTEAAAFVQVLIRFLAHHPQLARSRVVLVGESYGGPRAMHMLSQLLDYPRLSGRRFPFDGTRLAKEVEAQIATTHAPAPEGGFSPAQVGERFAQILIQPAVADWNVVPSEMARARSDDASRRFESMARAVLQPAVFDQHTGVAGASIRWMHADERRAQGLSSPPISPFFSELPSEAEFAQVFGALPGQRYFRPLVSVGVRVGDRYWGDTRAPLAHALRHVPTFITNARLDHVVDTGRVIDSLGTLPGVTSAQRRRVDLRVEQVDMSFEDGATRTLQFPSYPDSGHTVSLFEPALFADDVQQWLAHLP